MSEEVITSDNNIRIKKPKWLRVKLPTGENYRKVRSLVDEHKLHTICESGSCPNMGECWGEGTATFMILGNICTRSCGFCAVQTGRPVCTAQNPHERVQIFPRIMKVAVPSPQHSPIFGQLPLSQMVCNLCSSTSERTLR